MREDEFMYKRGIILLSSILLLTACGEDTTDTEVDDPVDGVEDVESEGTEEDVQEDVDNDTNEDDVEEDTNESATHLFDELINETTFSEEYGLQAWEDYKRFVETTTLGESTFLNIEESTAEDLGGTSTVEVEEQFAALDSRDDVFQAETQLSETEEMVLYRYPPEEDSQYIEMADFLAEISLYYASDNLMFASVTPGFYTLELDGNLPSTNDLMSMVRVDEIRELNPRAYTVAEMIVNGESIHQLMTPAMHVDESGEEVLMAFYFFAKGEDLLQYAYLPFETVAQDFPTNSILLYYQLIPELEKL